jgi:hypothetical protein
MHRTLGPTLDGLFGLTPSNELDLDHLREKVLLDGQFAFLDNLGVDL